MLALNGYYDGTAIQALEKINAKKNQKLIITVLDEFIEEIPKKNSTSARGSLAKYANTALWEKESTALGDETVLSAVIVKGEKYGNA